MEKILYLFPSRFLEYKNKNTNANFYNHYVYRKHFIRRFCFHSTNVTFFLNRMYYNIFSKNHKKYTLCIEHITKKYILFLIYTLAFCFLLYNNAYIEDRKFTTHHFLNVKVIKNK